MSKALFTRANNQCELCGANDALGPYSVPESQGQGDATVLLCQTCQTNVDAPNAIDSTHWRALNDSMWSPVPAVQVLAFRVLKRLQGEPWALDALEMLYLDDEMQAWAMADIVEIEDKVEHRDSVGNLLSAGDNVVVIKDLPVKGTSFVAKRGTAVRSIGLSADSAHIEGRVNGTRIMILTQYVKKM